MKNLRVLLMAAMLSVSLQAVARELVPVADLIDVPVASASGQALTAAQVKLAIQSAAASRQWTVTEPAPGRLLATRQWDHAKHTIVTEISYSADKYSLAYKDSTNMKYGMKDGQPVIHPRYNRFVQELSESIRLAVGRS